MSKSIGIIAYGTAEDRKKVEALSRLSGQSASAWIIEKIRVEYERVLGAPLPLPADDQPRK